MARRVARSSSKPKSGEFAVLKRIFPPLRRHAEGEKLNQSLAAPSWRNSFHLSKPVTRLRQGSNFAPAPTRLSPVKGHLSFTRKPVRGGTRMVA